MVDIMKELLTMLEKNVRGMEGVDCIEEHVTCHCKPTSLVIGAVKTLIQLHLLRAYISVVNKRMRWIFLGIVRVSKFKLKDVERQ